MNLHIHGSRPPSARPQSRINPITGEEMPFSARGEPRDTPLSARGGTKETPYSTRDAPARPALQAEGKHCVQNRSQTGNRPKNVPQLSLGKLADDDPDVMDITLHMDPYSYKLDSPGTASTVSWGTPGGSVSHRKLQDLQHYSDLSERVCGGIGQKDNKQRATNPLVPSLQLHDSQRSSRKPAPLKQPSSWDQQPVPENLPPPPEQYKQHYKQLQQEMRDSYRAHTDRSITNSEVERKIEELRLEVPPYVVPEDDDDRDALKKDWTQQPYSKAAQIRRQDKESLEEINRKKKLIETVMIDQLSRPVISRTAATSARCLSSRRADLQRKTGRTADDSRLMTGTATENLLSRRIQFGARVLTRNGRDAIRELTGFYFAVDNSITVYEFRQFGKSGKALPFIQRGSYTHLAGSKQGQPFTINNIKQGECLLFESRSQPISDALKAKDEVMLKITYVDDDSKAAILFEGVPLGAQDEVWKKAHIPQTTADIDAKLLLVQVQECTRHQIRKRGIKVMTGLCSLYQKLDENGDGRLNKVELDKSLIDYHIEIPQEHFEDLWDVLDTDASGFMEYDIFLRAFLGEMSENRKVLVLKAFRKIDSNKRGEITFDEIKKFYNAHKHPRVRSGECKEAEVMDNFLHHFSHTRVKGVVTFYEFECYYEGLSVCVEETEDFDKILQNAWSI